MGKFGLKQPQTECINSLGSDKENICSMLDVAIKDEQEGQQGYEKLKRHIILKQVETKDRELSKIFSQVEKIRRQEGKHVDKLNDMKLKIGCNGKC